VQALRKDFSAFSKLVGSHIKTLENQLFSQSKIKDLVSEDLKE
jgi:hypothetical protein